MTDTPRTAAGEPQIPIRHSNDREELLDLLMALRFADELMADRVDRMIQQIEEGHRIEAEAADSQAVRLPTVEQLARALHRIGNEFDDPFTAEHPEVMHTSQAAAILAALKEQPK